ncbi:MAG: LCP family protein [Patescibacteria group bacterium]|nr:LCP family protein [Patescibacteria group bacterium]
MLKFLIKFIVLLIVIIFFFTASLSYQFFSAGQKIFDNSEKISMIKQLEELVFNPPKYLKGEEENRINILLMGKGGDGHNGGDLTDTIIIASIKPQENEAALISIPRDLYVNIPGTNINTKINAVKPFGDKSKEKNGTELIKKLTSEISGLDIHYFVELDFNGFIKVIDEIGGIDVYLENDINDLTYPNFNKGYDPFYISKGWQHLDGTTALKVARSRHSKMGDFDRIKRQQIIIKATKQKIFKNYSKYDIVGFKNILDSLSENLKTDIQLKELPRFYKISKEIKNHKITAETIDTRKYLNRTYVGMGYTLQARDEEYEEIKNLTENIFNFEIPQERKDLIKKEGANIEIRNGTGTLDLANKVAFDLEEFGYRIIKSTNIGPPSFSGAQIYNYSGDLKPNTLDFLKEKFNAVIIETSNTEDEQMFIRPNTKADFVIVLGRGF